VLSNIRLQNFRSYRDASFEFEPGVNIIVGPNASGKTNLLEAVMVTMSGGSFRVRDYDLLRFGADWARLDANLGSSKRSIKLKLENQRVDKQYEIDNDNLRRLSLERTVPVVLFEPNHLQLISRGPDQRRQYFDEVLERTEPGYKSLSAKYRRALAQRNALLKTDRQRAAEQLFAWNVRLSELGEQIVKSRSRLIDELNKNLTKTYNKIAGGRAKVSLNYDSPLALGSYSSSLLSKLQKTEDDDFQRGFTGHGPHREDITVFLKSKPATVTASRGELRSIVLALKILELKLVETARGQKPVFLLDDVFSELDAARRQHLVDYLKDYQTLITTTDADSVIEYFDQQHLIPLHQA
jgi:DNA replication and repair protein RecF